MSVNNVNLDSVVDINVNSDANVDSIYGDFNVDMISGASNGNRLVHNVNLEIDEYVGNESNEGMTVNNVDIDNIESENDQDEFEEMSTDISMDVESNVSINCQSENECDTCTMQNAIGSDTVLENINFLKNKYPKNTIISHLNVNSLQQKFNEVKDLLKHSNFDVMVLSETKLDSSRRNALYEIENYSIYRQDKRSNSGGLLAYVSNNLQSTTGPLQICNDEIECVTIELNINNNKILLVCMYKNPKINPQNFKQFFEDTCEKLFDQYENVIIIGDLNFNMLTDNVLSHICPNFNLTNIINKPTCFKSNVPTLIDVMLVSKRKKFIESFSFDTGISDFHNIIGGVLRQYKPLPKQKIVYYRKLSDINYDRVNAELLDVNLENMICQTNNVNEAFDKLQNTLVTLLDRHAPKKQKIVKITDFPCMSKRLRKAILIRNKFRNKFFKHRSTSNLAEYRKHRNMVTLIKREEIKKYFEEKCKEGTKNKDFWKAMKPIFSKTRTKSDNIPLRENDKIITDCDQVCIIFNKFFREIGSDIGCTEDNTKPTPEILLRYNKYQENKIVYRCCYRSV
jgi:hypothetical protein